MSDSPPEVSLWERQRTLWRDNHGGLILAMMSSILLVGAATLAIRQNQFRPPRFPDASAIQGPGDTNLVSTIDGDIPVSEALSINVSGAVNDNGLMFLAIYGERNGFNDPVRAIARSRNSLLNGSATFTFRAKDLPPQIAISAYHDENSDDELSRNAIGIPTERYGFSNNARGTVGPPTFEDVVVERPESGAIEVYIR